MPLPEREWLNYHEHPDSMLYDELPNPISERKERLLITAFFRRAWHLITDVRVRRAIEVAERYADGQATPDELRSACATLEAFNDAFQNPAMWHGVVGFAFIASDPRASATDAAYVAAENIGRQAARAVDPDSDEVDEHALAIERAAQCALARELLGNPFRVIVFEPSWRTSTVVALARQMYEARDFSAMPILADALQDAGCDNEDILDHCRAEQTHVRGCWVVDVVLGKG
jgi:hypothetical protein